MTTWLKQSTATDVELGPFIDSTDGATVETGLTISQADCQLIKNGGAAAQKNDSTSATHLAGGHYKVPLNTTDTNTLGRLRLYVNESGALPVWRDFMVLPANIYDSLVGGSDYLDVSAVQIAGSAVSTTTAQIGVNVVQAAGTAWGSGAITAGAIATGAIDADALAADAVDEFWDEVLEGTLTGRQFMRIFMAVLAGESAGGGTSTITFRDLADTKDRISATIDSGRNRTAVTRDGS